MKEGKIYLFYDIIDDRIRNRIARACKDYGLERIQFSGFHGELNRNRRAELHLRLKKTLGDHTGKILILPLCEKDMRDIREIVVEGDDGHVPDGE